MTENLFNLDTLFAYADAAPLEAAEEARLILIAQGSAAVFGAEGVEEAQLTLLQAYGPALRSAVSRFTSTATGQSVLDVEDARMTAVSGFMEALHAHDPAQSDRLASTVVQHVSHALTQAATSAGGGFSVPKRTLTRFFGIMAEADSDLETALALAPRREMAADTFMSIYRSLGADSIEDLREEAAAGGGNFAASPVFAPSPVVDVEDRILCDAALRACDDDEHRVVSLQYGFQAVVEIVDGERVQVDRLPSDREIGDILGMTRPTVQRRGKSALTKMRKALCVTVGDVR